MALDEVMCNLPFDYRRDDRNPNDPRLEVMAEGRGSLGDEAKLSLAPLGLTSVTCSRL